MLSGKDRRSIGRANEAAKLVRENPDELASLMDCLCDTDPCVSMRAADAIEKLSRNQAELLQIYKEALLSLLAEAKQKEMRWHLALIVPRLELTTSECQHAGEVLQTYLTDRSSIVKTFAMQGLFELIRQDESLRPMVLDLIRVLTRTGTPAMRARGRILLASLDRENGES